MDVLWIISHFTKVQGIATLFQSTGVTVRNNIKYPEESYKTWKKRRFTVYRSQQESVLPPHPPPHGISGNACSHVWLWQPGAVCATGNDRQQPGMLRNILQPVGQPRPLRAPQPQTLIMQSLSVPAPGLSRQERAAIQLAMFTPPRSRRLRAAVLMPLNQSLPSEIWHSSSCPWFCEPGYSASAANLSSS